MQLPSTQSSQARVVSRRALHDSVTRNHGWPNIEYVMMAVRRFLNAAAPFPGNHHALATPD